MEINNKYNLGQFVFLKTDSDQMPRMITSIQVSFNGLLYRLACGSYESWHYEMEISMEKNILIDLGLQ